jgi:hypothetical protein
MYSLAQDGQTISMANHVSGPASRGPLLRPLLGRDG